MVLTVALPTRRHDGGDNCGGGDSGDPGDGGDVGDVVGGLDTPTGPRGVRGRSGDCSAASVNCTVQDRCSPVSTSK